MGFFIVIMILVLDFIGDYYVCVKMCNVLLFLNYVINRGIVIEGFCMFFFGIMGCGYVMLMYGGNVGVVGIIKVKIGFLFIKL